MIGHESYLRESIWQSPFVQLLWVQQSIFALFTETTTKGHSRSSKMPRTFDILGYNFLLVTHSNWPQAILYHFRDMQRQRSRITIFHTPPAFNTLVESDTVQIFATTFIAQKNKMKGKTNGEKVCYEKPFDVIPGATHQHRQTYRQAGGQKSCRTRKAARQ